MSAQAERDGITHIHAHFVTEPATVCHLAAKLLGITYSVSAHAADIWMRRPLQQVVEQATCCIACTAQGYEYLSQEFPAARIHLVRHGIEIHHQRNTYENTNDARPAPPPLRLISAGRFVPKKGFDLLIDACALLRRQGIEFECEVFGEGELRDSLQELIEKYDLSPNVKFHPFIPYSQLRKRFFRTHLLVLPCRIDPSTGDRDGIPNVLLEAIDCGAIVVASDLPTVREIIKDGVTGFLAPQNDAAALATTIGRALQVRDQWDAMRHRSKERLTRSFDLDRQTLLLKNFLEKSAGRPI